MCRGYNLQLGKVSLSLPFVFEESLAKRETVKTGEPGPSDETLAQYFASGLQPRLTALTCLMNSRSILTTTSLALLMAGSLSAETLSDQLSAKQKDFISKTPPEKAASYQAGIDAVAKSGIYDRAKKSGDKAPDFTLKNAAGKEVSLSSLLEKGPVVLTWYRGGWCPYCNLTLVALQEKLPEFQAAGATLVALTPELPHFTEDTTKKGEIAFEVLSDVGNNVARKYGIVFKMVPDVAEAMRNFAKTVERNGDESDELPLAAAYVIAPDGKITYAFLDADYRLRAEPSRLVDEVKAQTSKPSAPGQ